MEEPDPTTSGSAPIEDPKHFGTGWISGVLSCVLGAIGLLAVFCFHYPQILTMPELRALYPVPYIRVLLQLILITSFGLGVLSIYLRRDKSIGGIGILLTLIAAMFGGSRVPIDGEMVDGPFLGLDWFLLNLIAFSLIFVPLEQLFPHRRTQPIFRTFWKTDLAYFFVSAVFIQLATVLTLKPAVLFFDWASHAGLRSFIGGQPRPVRRDPVDRGPHPVLDPSTLPFCSGPVAFPRDPPFGRIHGLACRIATPFCRYCPHSQYWIHSDIYPRIFRGPPVRVHCFLRVYATFIHSNFRLGFGPLRWMLVTPRFHHWHHTSDLTYADKNFAVHLPILDRIFGTYYLPATEWPTAYGVTDGGVPPSGFFAQLAYPFRKRVKD